MYYNSKTKKGENKIDGYFAMIKYFSLTNMYFRELQLLLEKLGIVWLQRAATAHRLLLSSSALIPNATD